MTEVLLDYAEEKFIEGRGKEAFDLVSLAKNLDPYFRTVNNYYATFRVHYAATKKNRFGHTDLYAILGLKADPSLSVDFITSTFCKLVKLVHPDVFCSSAAPGALRLINQAWEVLSDETSRKAYDVRMGLRPPPSTKPKTDQRRLVEIKRCAPKVLAEGDASRVVRGRRVTG
ncbi:hypothetical protein I3760_07G014000 [Carya illinoinensis]|nr:hypothetical protein I3760_07G014000 [Carya illinoinensis]